MITEPMGSLERVLVTLGHREPDRVPLFLLLSLHGAQEVGLSIGEYFARAENVAEGQLRLRERYGNDCLDAFFYAPIGVEAWGEEVVFADDGPPNSGEPPLRSAGRIRSAEPPPVSGSPRLQEVLRTIRILRERAGGGVPIVGVAVSPFSLPVMQMGFDRYIELIHEDPETFRRFMEVNEEFCVAWANAQLEAGATAICYFDPVASPTIVPREVYLRTGHPVACRTLARIKGPTATHLASGAALPIIGDIVATGTAIIGVSAEEDLALLKASCRGKLTILGNLNGITMRNWTAEQARAAVKEAIRAAGPGGGFILSDNHGEIPFQVPARVIAEISDAAREWGRYPLDWIGRGER